MREEEPVKRAILVCAEPRLRRVEGIEILPWQSFLERLWSDRLLRT